MDDIDLVSIACPVCGCTRSVVTDSRGSKTGNHRRRRRRCHNCKHKFSTYETTIRPKDLRPEQSRNEVIDTIISVLRSMRDRD